MANPLKEDEKNERLIRGLLKLPENRRCINCNSLGPQYVCTNFWTFICTNCSGIHREFTHRVKSVSMAKFTSHEVNALQEGGNQRAKEIYLKDWDSQRHSHPDTSNCNKLRDFIKHVYVDRRYSGERNYDKPPRGKMCDKEGSRSPSYEDTKSSSGGRSPEHEQGSRHIDDNKRSPSRPWIVNDWHRVDRFGNGTRSEDRISSDEDYRSEGQSPERPYSSSPPVVLPVRNILGDNTIPLRISEPPKANGGRFGDGLTHTHVKRIASSSSLGSTTENAADIKLDNTGSLIDFDSEPEPPVLDRIPEAQQSAVTCPVTGPAKAAIDNNWASFDVASVPKAPQGPSIANANTLDSLLLEISAPAPVPCKILGSQGGSNIFAAPTGGSLTLLPGPNGIAFPSAGNIPVPSFTSTGGSVASPGSFQTALPANVPVTRAGLTTMNTNGGELPASNANQWSNMQDQLPVIQSLGQHVVPTSAVASYNQTLNMPPITQGPLNGPLLHASLAGYTPVLQTTSGVATQSHVPEIKSSGRNELPEDLFAASFAPFPPSMPGWQMGPPYHMAAPIQYNSLVLAPNAMQSQNPANPFGVSGETHSVQAPAFPSLSSLQGALPNVFPPSASLTPTPISNPAWMPPQPTPYGFAPPLQVPSHPSAMASANMSFTGYQGTSGIGSEGASFGPLNPIQQLASTMSAPAAPSHFTSTGGNPFG